MGPVASMHLMYFYEAICGTFSRMIIGTLSFLKKIALNFLESPIKTAD